MAKLGRYGAALYVLLYLFAVAVAMGLVSMMIAVLDNKEVATPHRQEQDFYLTRARCRLQHLVVAYTRVSG